MTAENAVWKKILNTGIAFKHHVWLVPQGQRGNRHYLLHPTLNRKGKFCYAKRKAQALNSSTKKKGITVPYFSHLCK